MSQNTRNSKVFVSNLASAGRPFWVHFGDIFVPILGPFRVHFGTRFGTILGQFLAPGLIHFGDSLPACLPGSGPQIPGDLSQIRPTLLGN